MFSPHSLCGTSTVTHRVIFIARRVGLRPPPSLSLVSILVEFRILNFVHLLCTILANFTRNKEYPTGTEQRYGPDTAVYFVVCIIPVLYMWYVLFVAMLNALLYNILYIPGI